MKSVFYFHVKKFIDTIIALVLLMVCLLPMLAISIAIKLDSKGPVLFKQKRTGYKGSTFYLYKFRSMSTSNDVLNFKEANKITKVGSFLRKTSLDEIPQLFNILKGEMSFIGPRPWIVEYAKYFTPRQKERLNVLPGITGLAQACGRNNISINDKIELDIKYVNRFSIFGDILVLFWSVKTILSQEGSEISKAGIKNELSELEVNYNRFKRESIEKIIKKDYMTRHIPCSNLLRMRNYYRR